MTNDREGVLAYGGVQLSRQVEISCWHIPEVRRTSAKAR